MPCGACSQDAKASLNKQYRLVKSLPPLFSVYSRVACSSQEATIPTIDFEAIKANVTLEQAAQYLGLTLKREGEQLRSACRCKPDDKRILVLTPSKAVWYCHNYKRGGDVVGLVSHIRDIGMYKAANELAAHFLPREPATAPQNHQTREPTRAPFDPQKYFESLNPFAEELSPLNLDRDMLEQVGGYKDKGVLKGCIAIALRGEHGNIMGFLGIPLDAAVKWPKNFKR